MSYRTIQLADVPLRELIPVKVTAQWIRGRDHSRWVLRTRHSGDTSGRFFKIWNPTYVRRDNILSAIEAGFYDARTTPALDALVFHRDICRGYVMKSGVPYRRLRGDFFDVVTVRTRETGYFHVQFSASHTMLCDDKVSLLDLEAVFPIASYARYRGKLEDADYERFVARLYAEAFPDKRLPSAQTERGTKYPGRSYHTRGLPSFAHRLRGIPVRGWRQFRIQLGNRRPRISLIDL